MKWLKNLLNKYYFSKLMKKYKGELFEGFGVVKIFGKTIIFTCNSVTRDVSILKKQYHYYKWNRGTSGVGGK